MKSGIRKSLIVLSYLIVSILVFRSALLQTGVIGLRHDWAIPPYPEQVSLFGFEGFYTWHPQSLGLNPSYPADFLLKAEFGLASLLGFGGDVLSKAFCVVVMFLSGLSMYYLCSSLRLKDKSSFIAGLFYMLTPVVFNRVVAGQIAYVFAYALSPFVIALFMKSLENHRIRYRLLALSGLLLAFAGVQFQFLVMLFALLLAYSFFTRNIKEAMTRIKALLVAGFIVFLVHAFWLLPFFANGGSGVQTNQAVTLSWLQAQSPSILDALRLTGFIGRYFESSVGATAAFSIIWQIVSFLVPVIAFLAIFLRPHDKGVIFFTLVAVISLFFAKGVNPPFEGVFVFMFWNVSLTAMFREVYHLMFIPALAFGVLLGISFETISELSLNVRRVRFHTQTKKAIATLTMVGIIFVYSWPIFTGDFAGNIQVYNLKSVYNEVHDDFSSEEGDFRVLYLPMAQPMTYDGLEYAGINPLIEYAGKPSLSQFLPTAGSGGKYTDFVHITFSQDRTALIGHLLSFSSAKYILFSKDFVSRLSDFVLIPRYPDVLQSYTNERLDYVLQNQKDISLKKVLSNKRVYIYENTEWRPLLYAVDARNVAMLAGDLSSLVSLSYTDDILSEDGLFIFASQTSIESNPSNLVDTVVIQRNGFLDYVFSFIPDIYKTDPGDHLLENADPLNGWTRTQSWWWYNWHYSAALENSVFTQNKGKLTIELSSPEPAQYDIWAKVYFGKLGSSLNFSLNDVELNRVVTKNANDEGFKWVNLGSTNLEGGSNELLISSEKGENVVQRIIMAPSRAIQEAYETAYSSLQNKKVILLFESEKSPYKGPFWAPAHQGFNASQGLAMKSTISQQFADTLYIPKDDSYEIFLRADQKPRRVMIDNDTFEVSEVAQKSDFSFKWYKVGPTHLQEGSHSALFIFEGTNVNLDLLLAQSVDPYFLKGEDLPSSIVYYKLNPTKYIVHVSASAPFFLAFGECYHPSWHAIIDGEQLEHYKVNSFANGYYVKNTGTYTMTIEFMEQKLYETGLAISFGTIIVLTIAVTIQEKALARLFFKGKRIYSIIKQTFKNL